MTPLYSRISFNFAQNNEIFHNCTKCLKNISILIGFTLRAGQCSIPADSVGSAQNQNSAGIYGGEYAHPNSL